MTDNVIKLEKDNVLRLDIETSEGVLTGEFLEFQMDDIELPLRYQELLEKNKKNRENLKNQMLIIDKRQDIKGKKLMSKNEEDKVKAINDFFQKQVEVYNMFLGENGVQKLLNGRKLGWTTLQKIDDIIDKQIAPLVKNNVKDLTQIVKEKYEQAKQKSEEQIEVIE